MSDLISREAVLDMVEDMTDQFGNKHRVVTEGMISLLPPVNLAKTGKWIKYSIPRCGEQHYKCTSCGYYINFGQWGELYTKEFKYCPNCGARMEGEEV